MKGGGNDPAPSKRKTDMNNEIRELTMDEMDAVSGAGWSDVVIAVVEVVGFALDHHGLSDAINYIKGQAGK